MHPFAFFVAAVLLAAFSFVLGLLQRRPAPVTPARRSYGPTAPPVVSEFDRAEVQGYPVVTVDRECRECGEVSTVVGGVPLGCFVCGAPWRA